MCFCLMLLSVLFAGTPQQSSEPITINGFRNHVDAILPSNDHRFLYVSSEHDGVWVFDLKTLASRGFFPLPLDCHRMAVSSDSTMIAAGLDNIHFFDSRGLFLGRITEGKEVFCMEFLPRNNHLVTGGESKLVCIWDIKRRVKTTALAGHTGAVSSLAIHPSGTTIASGGDGNDGSIRIWDVKTKKQLIRLAEHKNVVASLHYSSDGEFLISASWDDTINLWDPTSKQPRITINAGQEGISTLALSSDDRYLASAGSDRTVKIWDLRTRKNVGEIIGLDGLTFSIAFLPGTNQIAVSSCRESENQYYVKFYRLGEVIKKGKVRGGMRIVDQVDQPVRPRGVAGGKLVGPVE